MASVKLENKTARILHISMGGGAVCTVPPTEPGQPGITVTFSDSEKEAFDKNIATDEVQSWIDAGDLVVTEVDEEPPPEPEVDEDDV